MSRKKGMRPSAAPVAGLEATPKEQLRERTPLSGASPGKEMSSAGGLDSAAIVDFSPEWDDWDGGSKLLICLATATDFCASKEDPLVYFGGHPVQDLRDSPVGEERLVRIGSNESTEEKAPKALWKRGKQEPAIRLQNGSRHWVSYTVLQEDKLKTKTVEKNVTDTILASLNATFAEGAGARAERSRAASVLTKQEGAPHFLMEDCKVRPSLFPGDADFDVDGTTVPYPTGCKELRVLAYFQGRKAWIPYKNKVYIKKSRTTHVLTAVDGHLDGYESSEEFFDTTAVSDGVDGDGLDGPDASDRISSTSVEEIAPRSILGVEVGTGGSTDENDVLGLPRRRHRFQSEEAVGVVDWDCGGNFDFSSHELDHLLRPSATWLIRFKLLCIFVEMHLVHRGRLGPKGRDG